MWWWRRGDVVGVLDAGALPVRHEAGEVGGVGEEGEDGFERVGQMLLGLEVEAHGWFDGIACGSKKGVPKDALVC